jgi:hypothetical protein
MQAGYDAAYVVDLVIVDGVSHRWIDALRHVALESAEYP